MNICKTGLAAFAHQVGTNKETPLGVFIFTKLTDTYVFMKLPSQQEKIHAHSFVLTLELGIQYTYIYIWKILSTIDFQLDARSSRFSQEFTL